MKVELSEIEMGLINEWFRRAHTYSNGQLATPTPRSTALHDRLRASQRDTDPFPVDSAVYVQGKGLARVVGRWKKGYLIVYCDWNGYDAFAIVGPSELSKFEG